MKTGIIIAMAALGLAIFAVPDTPAEARGGWHHGPDVNQTALGEHLSPLSVDGRHALGNTTAMQNWLAKGQPGSAHIARTARLRTGGRTRRALPRRVPFGAHSRQL